MAFIGTGRRLNDGAAMAAPRKPIVSFKTAVTIIVLACGLGTVPGHDSFEDHLAATASHPSNMLGGLSAFANRLHISVSSSSRSYIFFRTGVSPSGASFVGAFNSWVYFAPPALALPSLRLPDSAVGSICGVGGGAPMAFVWLLLAGFVVAQIAPTRVVLRHASCSLAAMLEGRLWTMLTANLVHFSPIHLLNTLLQAMHYGPIVQATLGCERTLQLLGAVAAASSLASVCFHGLLRGRRHEGSVGASGVACGLIGANAALFPRTRVRLLGMELEAYQQLLLYLALDAIAARDRGRARRGGAGGAAGEIDLSAHVGGAAAGWALARRWAPVRLW